MDTIPKTIVHDFEVGATRLSVTIFEDKLYLNSNSLKAIKQFISKLWLDGHILTRVDIEKTIYDVYRYFRAYRVLGKGAPFSEN